MPFADTTVLTDVSIGTLMTVIAVSYTHLKQTMRQLMKQNAGVSNIEITDSNIKAFESTATKYNIDFSLKKVKGCLLYKYRCV